MKKTLLFLTLLGFAISNYAQEIYSENFDSYTPGSGVALQAGSPWTTWSNDPGSSEDPFVSNDTSFSAANSVKVIDNNDGVLGFNTLTSGRYRIDFQIFIQAGKTAYFNVLQEFYSGNYTWGLQAYFRTDSTGSVDAGGADAAIFNYVPGSWIPVQIFIDLDNDIASFFLDSSELVTWQWSKGTFGQSNLLQLDAMNFYGWNSEGSCQYYIDDISLTQLEDMAGPQNFTATLIEDDVTLSWDAPASGTVDAYTILRNGQMLANEITDLTYTDVHLYPMSYEYSILAFVSGQGYLPAENSEDVTIEGGVDRQLALFEIGTGTWCQYCPGAAMGADELMQFNRPVAIVEYHGYEGAPDNYINEFSLGRIDYYGIDGYPTTIIDGTNVMVGGSADQSLYDTYNPAAFEALDIPALYNINIDGSKAANGIYTLNIDVSEEYQYFDNDIKLYAVLTESHIEEEWLGQEFVNYACKEMFPDANGTTLDFSTDSTQSLSFDFEVDMLHYLTAEDYEFIVFVQHTGTNMILQTNKINLGDIKAMYDVTFNVDMHSATDFDSSQDTVYIAGSMTGWSMPGSDESLILSDEDNDSIYTITLSVEEGEVQYKYFLNSGWSGGEWEGDPNRVITVSEDVTVNNIWGDVTDNSKYIELDKLVHMYPNPATNEVFVSGPENSVITVYNLTGQLLITENLSSSSTKIDVSSLNSGIYLLKVENNFGETNKKLVIK